MISPLHRGTDLGPKWIHVTLANLPASSLAIKHTQILKTGVYTQGHTQGWWLDDVILSNSRSHMQDSRAAMSYCLYFMFISYVLFSS